MSIPGVRAPALPAAPTLDISPLLKALKQQAAPHNFGGQAQTLAAHDVAAAVAGIRAQQDQIRQAAAMQAGQVNDAATAAAKFLQGLGLGDAVAQDYAHAADASRAAAAGYAGGLRTTVDDAAAQVQRNLGAIGSNQTVPNNGADAGNVLYGLGGNLPAATLDVVGPTVAAGVRALPAQTLGYGQQVAVGIQGAGAQHAGELDANVAEAQAKQAEIAAGYLKQLEDAARARGQDAVANTLKVLGIQQDANAAAARAAYEQASLGLRADTANQSAALRAADLNATQQYREQQARADAAYRDGQLSVSQYNAETSRIRAAKAAAHNKALERQAAKSATAKPTIIGSDRAGRYRLNPDGTKTLLIPPVKQSSSASSRASTTASQRQAARNFLFQQRHGYYATEDDPDTPLSPSEMRAAQQAGQTVGKVTVAPHQDEEIQNIYMTLVQKYGIPARQAFNMVAGHYKAWGAAKRPYYFPTSAAAVPPRRTRRRRR